MGLFNTSVTRISRNVERECVLGVFYQSKKFYMSDWLIRSRERLQSVTSYTNRDYIPIRFITGSLGVRTRRRRRKLLTASCSLLLLRDWRVSSRTSSRSSPTLDLGMGQEALRSEQERYSPVSITRTENIVTHGFFTIYRDKVVRERFMQMPFAQTIRAKMLE